MSAYYVDIQGKTAGPFSLEQLRDLYAAGTVDDRTNYSTPGAVEWIPLRVIVPLFTAKPPVIPAQRPASPIVSHRQPEQRVTIQKTSKPIKAFGALFTLGLVASILMVICSGESGWQAVGWIGVLLSIGGIALNRILCWWQHD